MAYRMISRMATSNTLRSIGIRSMATTTSWTDMANSKTDFVKFVNAAATNPSGPHSSELTSFLTKCFVDCDSDYDGLVSFRGFNNMIDEAAAAPRRFGFAPHTRELYDSKEAFDEARTSLFDELAGENSRVGLESWIAWSREHIVGKVGSGLETHNDCRWERSEADFVSFFKGVAAESSSHCKRSSSSTQYKEFYMLLNGHFLEADSNNDGVVSSKGFGTLVSRANDICARFGYDWFSNVRFSDVAVDGKVTFKNWLDYAVKVVVGKANAL